VRETGREGGREGERERERITVEKENEHLSPVGVAMRAAAYL
jgi:hypothetical protein